MTQYNAIQPWVVALCLGGLWALGCNKGAGPSAEVPTDHTGTQSVRGASPGSAGRSTAQGGGELPAGTTAGPDSTAGPVADGAGAAAPATDAPDPDAPFAVSQRNAIQWKRYAAVEADLMRGLDLRRDQVCQELGERNCVRDIHLVALGGNDPFGTSLTRPSKGTLSTTPLVLDRVVLSACTARARADRAGPAKVFGALDLSGPAPAPDDAAVEATITALFRRLLARDPRSNEGDLIKTLLDSEARAEPLTAETFAALSCFVVGSSLEFLFF